MKKNNLTKLVSLLAAALAISPVFAQNNEPVIAAAYRASSTPVVHSAAPAPAAVSDKVQRSFERHFKSEQSPRWKTATDHYVAEFKTEGRLALATFNKKGHLVCTVVYGTEKNLPATEKGQVQTLYRDYDITAVQEVITPEHKLWVVTLNSCKHIVKVRMLDGEVMELERWQRSK